MKILIIGSGGREYSIAKSISKDSRVKELFVAPGNGMTSEFAKNIDIKDLNSLANFAQTNSIDLTIVGPEAPLVEGVVDIFRSKNLKIFGPSKEAAKLEGSKAFMKNFLKKYNIPTAKYIETSIAHEAIEFAKGLSAPIVVKADGLCAGKGVVIASSIDEAIVSIEEMLSGDAFGDAGRRVVVEEYLDGFELSLFAICDGESYKILPPSQDHKRLLAKDLGPNTGGMGAYAPTPLATKEIVERIEKEIVAPSLEGMKSEGFLFEGVLFCGVMVVEGAPYLLEFNVRFGDPECEILMPLIESSILDMFIHSANRDLDSYNLKIKDGYCVGVVVASKEYPQKSSSGEKIEYSSDALDSISFAGVKREGEDIYTNGGRILVAIGEGSTIKDARDRAYDMVSKIKFDGMRYRDDIAYQALKEQGDLWKI